MSQEHGFTPLRQLRGPRSDAALNEDKVSVTKPMRAGCHQELAQRDDSGWHRLRAHRTIERLGIRLIRIGDHAHGAGRGGELAANADLAESNDRTDNRDAVAGVQTTGMSMLTIAQIDQKIRIAQEGLARAGDNYDRNLYAQIQSEYEAYRKARLEADLKQSAQRP
jgi:hypothetical protein